MKEIDINNWERKEHYTFFSRMDLPFYNVNFKLDITGLREYAGENGVSINNLFIYLTMKSINQIKNFLYRIEKGKIIEYEQLDPSFACLRNGEELFRFITVEFTDDIKAFDTNAKKAIENSKEYFDLSYFAKRTNFVFISAIPWIPFTATDHTMGLNKEDAVPRISWGKFQKKDGKVMLPYNIQVNHTFVDGIHVGKFYEKLNEEIAGIRS